MTKKQKPKREDAERKVREADPPQQDARPPLKEADFDTWLPYPAWRFGEAAHLLAGFEPTQDFDPKDRDNCPRGSPRQLVGLMYDRLKAGADMKQFKFTEGIAKTIKLRKADPQALIRWARERHYPLPPPLETAREQPKPLSETAERGYLRIIGALLGAINGENGFDPHQGIKSEADLIKKLAKNFESITPFSVASLEAKFPRAKEALKEATGK